MSVRGTDPVRTLTFGSVTVEVLPDAMSAKARLAERFAALAQDAVAVRGRFDVALAGGTTPQEAYALLASPPYLREVPWGHVHIWFGDERCVPPDHPDSNFGMVRAQLLSRVDIPSEHVHRMEGERVPEEAAAMYSAELGAAFGPRLPIRYAFDLVLLGMGGEGHTASLFPGSKVLEWKAPAAAPFVEKLGAPRLTLTPRALNDARAVIFLVTGGGKAWAVRESLKGNRAPIDMPTRAIRPAHGDVLWLLDPEAAAGLDGA